MRGSRLCNTHFWVHTYVNLSHVPHKPPLLPPPGAAMPVSTARGGRANRCLCRAGPDFAPPLKSPSGAVATRRLGRGCARPHLPAPRSAAWPPTPCLALCSTAPLCFPANPRCSPSQPPRAWATCAPLSLPSCSPSPYPPPSLPPPLLLLQAMAAPMDDTMPPLGPPLLPAAAVHPPTRDALLRLAHYVVAASRLASAARAPRGGRNGDGRRVGAPPTPPHLRRWKLHSAPPGGWSGWPPCQPSLLSPPPPARCWIPPPWTRRRR